MTEWCVTVPVLPVALGEFLQVQGVADLPVQARVISNRTQY